MLIIKNLSKFYKTKKVLDAISMQVASGEIALLLGSSGVGKSTLLRVLNGLETYDTGSIIITDKQPIQNNIQNSTNYTHDSSDVGMVFQQFNLFENMSVERNITFALERVAQKTPEQAHSIAHTLLAKYGLEDKAHFSVSSLSGGQKQRLAIARTLALKPKVICLDEPTSALDPLLTNYVAQNIQDLAQEGYSVLVASHDIALIEKLSCTIYLMHQGHIEEKALSAEFLANKNSYPHIKDFIEGVARN